MGHKSQTGTDEFGILEHVDPTHLHSARIGFNNSGNHPQQGRFSCPVSPQKNNEFSWLNSQTNSLKSDCMPEPFLDVFNLNTGAGMKFGDVMERMFVAKSKE